MKGGGEMMREVGGGEMMREGGWGWIDDEGRGWGREMRGN